MSALSYNYIKIVLTLLDVYVGFPAIQVISPEAIDF